MKYMYVHGVGFHEKPGDLAKWVPAWSGAIQQAGREIGIDLPIHDPLGADGCPSPQDDPGVLYYEDIVASHPNPSGAAYLKAVAQLLASGISTTVSGWFGRDRELAMRGGELPWKARQVAAWVLNDELRRDLRTRVVAEIEQKQPEVIIAHSYGGLILYDACLFAKRDLLDGIWLVTIGTQIGNPLLRRELGGRQEGLRCKHWFNLFNPEDPVFVSNMDHIRADNYTNIVTRHAHGHDGTGYLGFRKTAEEVWRPLSLGDRWVTENRRSRKLFQRVVPTSGRRALLVGIDRYADPRVPDLAGCVNDTYLLSAALQESGFKPHEIRLLHNERATRDGLLDQLDWLLEGVEGGEERVFAFSGHGDQCPAMDLNGEPDQLDEILVTHDYDFEADSGIRDNDLFAWYANLPYEARLMMILDCCHSGGAYRDGGPLVRSVSVPSDIAHQSLRWREKTQMWEQRGLEAINEDLLPSSGRSKQAKQRDQQLRSLWYGNSGATRRIGRASQLRDLAHERYDAMLRDLNRTAQAAKTNGEPISPAFGPFLPLIYMACGENQKACEYLHGSVSYGAFTYSLVQALRDQRVAGRKPSYESLVKLSTRKLIDIGYEQRPSVLGPYPLLKAKVLSKDNARVR